MASPRKISIDDATIPSMLVALRMQFRAMKAEIKRQFEVDPLNETQLEPDRSLRRSYLSVGTRHHIGYLPNRSSSLRKIRRQLRVEAGHRPVHCV